MRRISIMLIGAVCSSMLLAVAEASHEGEVAHSAVVVSLRDLGVTVTAKCDDKGGLESLSIKAPDFECSVPKSELVGIGDNLDLGSLRFLVGVHAPGEKLTKEHLKVFSVSFAYGPITVNIHKGDEVHTLNEVRFEFSNGKYDKRVRCISDGDESSSWRILHKEVGGKDRVVNKIASHSKNPLGRDL